MRPRTAGPKPYYNTGERCSVWFEPTEVWELRGAGEPGSGSLHALTRMSRAAVCAQVPHRHSAPPHTRCTRRHSAAHPTTRLTALPAPHLASNARPDAVSGASRCLWAAAH